VRPPSLFLPFPRLVFFSFSFARQLVPELISPSSLRYRPLSLCVSRTRLPFFLPFPLTCRWHFPFRVEHYRDRPRFSLNPPLRLYADPRRAVSLFFFTPIAFLFRLFHRHTSPEPTCHTRKPRRSLFAATRVLECNWTFPGCQSFPRSSKKSPPSPIFIACDAGKFIGF